MQPALRHGIHDASFPEGGVCLNNLSVAFVQSPVTRRVVGLIDDGARFGDVLSDNSHEEMATGGTRYPLAFYAVLGWSPLVRSLFEAKEEGDPTTDEVEDGGRAIAIEEGIAAAAFDYASRQRGLTSTGSRYGTTAQLGHDRGLRSERLPCGLGLPFSPPSSWRQLRRWMWQNRCCRPRRTMEFERLVQLS
jgi:hypothetical protein